MDKTPPSPMKKRSQSTQNVQLLNSPSPLGTSVRKRKQLNNAKGVFVIEVTEAKNLAGSKSLTDPYIKIKHDGILTRKHKWISSTQHKTTNPKWQTEQCLGYILDLNPFQIEVLVYDQDTSWKGRDECLGAVTLKSPGSEDTISSGWYPLEATAKQTKCRGGQIKIALSLKYGSSCVEMIGGILQDIPQEIPPTRHLTKKNTANSRPTSSIFEFIKKNSHPGLIDFLQRCDPSEVNALDADGNSALHLACLDCKKLDHRILHTLLNFQGINLNLANASLNTPLHYFCGKWEDPNLALLDLFLNQGADVDAINASGESPLFKAIANNSIRKPLMSRLLKQGADPHKVNTKGDRLLHYAARMGRLDIVDLILRYSADLNVKGAEGLTPSQICSHYAQNETDTRRKGLFLAIHAKLEKMQALFQFLDDLSLCEEKTFFVDEELDLDLLLHLDDEAILAFPFLLGRKYKLLTAVKKARESLPKKTIEDKLAVLRTPASGANTESLANDLVQLSLSGSKEVRFVSKSQLEFLDELGRGAFGCVYKGYLNWDNLPPIEVAIKCLISDQPGIPSTTPLGNSILSDVKTNAEALFSDQFGASQICLWHFAIFSTEKASMTRSMLMLLGPDQLGEFKKEFQILSKLSHPNVVGFFAVCAEAPAFIMEYCAGGSLNSNLKKDANSWKWPDFFRVAIQATSGLLHLHNNDPQILHRDLKSHNLLLTSTRDVKVADFGLSRENSSVTSDSLKALQGTAQYVAPEALLGCKFTAKSDVYSMGILLWEMVYRIITGTYMSPFAEYADICGPASTVILLLKVTNEHLRPTIPLHTPFPVRSLICACFDANPEHRPDLQLFYDTLVDLQHDFEISPNIYKAAKPPLPTNPTPTGSDCLNSSTGKATFVNGLKHYHSAVELRTRQKMNPPTSHSNPEDSASKHKIIDCKVRRSSKEIRVIQRTVDALPKQTQPKQFPSRTHEGHDSKNPEFGT